MKDYASRYNHEGNELYYDFFLRAELAQEERKFNKLNKKYRKLMEVQNKLAHKINYMYLQVCEQASKVRGLSHE